MNNYTKAKQLVEQGLLSMKTDEEVELFCYTQDCFFGKDTWDGVTKSHRGQMYYQGEPVNKPFEKIFNVGEVTETSLDTVVERMATEPYKILDKINGHLFIVSCFKVDGRWVVKYSTKGGLPNEGNDLLNDDIKIWKEWFEERMIHILTNTTSDAITLMFEAIVEHDKHTLFDLEVDKYGSNIFVLLGGNSIDEDGLWHEIPRYRLNYFTEELDLPLVKLHSDLQGSPNDWLEHKNTEGYVIWFENGDRVKVKTKEYWLARTKKDLTPEKIFGVFKSAGFDRINLRFPEELAPQLCELIIGEFQHWLITQEWNISGITYEYFGMTSKGVAMSNLTQGQKEYLLGMRQKKVIIDMVQRASMSRDKRKRFYVWFVEEQRGKIVEHKLEKTIGDM